MICALAAPSICICSGDIMHMVGGLLVTSSAGRFVAVAATGSCR
jgi:hypothetical protein